MEAYLIISKEWSCAVWWISDWLWDICNESLPWSRAYTSVKPTYMWLAFDESAGVDCSLGCARGITIFNTHLFWLEITVFFDPSICWNCSASNGGMQGNYINFYMMNTVIFLQFMKFHWQPHPMCPDSISCITKLTLHPVPVKLSQPGLIYGNISNW